MTIVVESLPWLQRQKGWVWGAKISTEMDLMCHVIATRVRSSGFWWASCWSALPSRVKSAIPFGSRATFFVKSFSIICWQNCAPGSPTTFTPAFPPPGPSQLCKIIRHKFRCSGMVGKSMTHKLPWSSYQLGQLFLTKSFFPDLGITSYIRVFMHVGNFFWKGAHSHVSGGPPNQAWHHTRGLICYPTLISTLPATSTPLHHDDQGQTLAPINPCRW